MFLTFQYGLLPTRAQHEALEAILESERLLYNAALQERRDAWRLGKHRIGVRDQRKSLTLIRSDDIGYSGRPVNLSRWTLDAVDRAFKGFFSRCKTGGKVGFPRFRSKSRWSSFGFAEWSGVRLMLSKSPRNARIQFKGMPGTLRVRLHRPLPADARLCSCVFTKRDLRWVISIQIEVPDFIGPHAHADRAVGIDVNILNRATLSTGEVIDNPRIGKAFAADLRVAQRAFARRPNKASRRRAKAVRRLRAVHRKVANVRKTTLHQVSAKLARDYGVISREKLQLRNMVRSGKGTVENPGSNIRQKAGLNRSLQDVAIGTFFLMLAYKAARAGGLIVAVDPRRSSIECSGCHAMVPKTLKNRVHRCPHCGLTMGRDHNAARNIEFRAQAVVGLGDANVDQIAA